MIADIKPVGQGLAASRENRSLTFIVLLVSFVVYGLGLFVLNYRVSFGERDSYRVLIGITDAIARGHLFAGPLVYGQSASPGYFAALDFARTLGVHNFIALTNWITFWSALAAAPLLFWAVRNVATTTIALGGVVVLAAIPVWWNTAQYSHPMWPSITLFIAGLALVSGRPSWLRSLAAVGVLALAFSMRYDAVLMAPMMLACCYDGERFSWPKAAKLILIGVAALALMLTIVHFGNAVAKGGKTSSDLASPLSDLMYWDSPKRFVGMFVKGSLLFFRALGLFVIAAALLNTISLVLQKTYRLLLLCVPVIALNFLFWVPNAYPERHYLYLAPAIAVLASYGIAVWALEGETAVQRGAGRLSLGALIVGVALQPLCPGAAILVLASIPASGVTAWRLAHVIGLRRLGPALAVVTPAIVAVAYVGLEWALHHTHSHLGPLEANEIARGQGGVFTCEAEQAMATPIQAPRLLVLSDANPTVASMQQLMPGKLNVRLGAAYDWIMVGAPGREMTVYQGGDPLPQVVPEFTRLYGPAQVVVEKVVDRQFFYPPGATVPPNLSVTPVDCAARGAKLSHYDNRDWFIF